MAPRGQVLPGVLIEEVCSNGSCFDFDEYQYRYLVVFDISDPTAPTVLGNEMTSFGTYSTVEVRGSHAYWAKDKTIAVVDVSNPDTPTQSTTMEFSSNVGAMHIEGDVLFVGLSSGELIMIDIGEPPAPSQIGSIDIGSGISDLMVRNGYAFAFGDPLLTILYVSDLENPAPLCRSNDEEGISYRSADLSGDYAYVSTDQGLRVLDISVTTR